MNTAGEVWFGQGWRSGAVGITIAANGQSYRPISIWTYGTIEIEFQYLLKGPFGSEEKRGDLLRRLNEIEGIRLLEDSITRHPNISMEALSGETRLARFLEVMGWLVAGLRLG